VTLSFLVPTVCRLPPWTIALIVMSAFALVVALFGATVTCIDGIIVIWIRCNVKQIQTLQESCRKNKYEIGRGELCLWYGLVDFYHKIFIRVSSGMMELIKVIKSFLTETRACRDGTLKNKKKL